MLTQRLAVTLLTAVLGTASIAGCTKRLVTTTASTLPAPPAASGADTTRAATLPTARPAAAFPSARATSGMPNDQRPDGGEQGRPAGRPAVTDFRPVFELADVHFEFDRYDILPAQATVLEANARWLRTSRDLVLIEGHCDERGTSEYNLALGERRAVSARNYLVSQGIAANRITIVSYGKERPQCTDRIDSCWRQNRRARFLVKPQ